MEALTIIGASAAIAIVGGISFVVDRYSWGTHEYRPFNPKTIWVSFVCGLLIAVGVYLLRTGLPASTLFVLGCGILVCGIVVYVRLLVFVTRSSAILIAIWTVTILLPLSPFLVMVLLGRRVFRREAASLDGPEDPCLTYGNGSPLTQSRSSDGPRQSHRGADPRCSHGDHSTMSNRERIDNLKDQIKDPLYGLKALSHQIDSLERQIEKDLKDLSDRIDSLEDRIDRLE